MDISKHRNFLLSEIKVLNPHKIKVKPPTNPDDFYYEVENFGLYMSGQDDSRPLEYSPYGLIDTFKNDNYNKFINHLKRFNIPYTEDVIYEDPESGEEMFIKIPIENIKIIN